VSGVFADQAKGSGATGFTFPVEQKVAGGKFRDELFANWKIGGDVIALVDVVFGGGPAMIDWSLVGEEEDASGVFVETPDGFNPWIAVEPTRREELVDGRALTGFMRADETGGFVQQDEKTLRMIERFVIDEDLMGIDLEGSLECAVVEVTDAALFNPVFGFAA